MRRQGVISILLAGITGLSFLGLIGTAPAARSAPQSGVVGDGLPGSCTEAALAAALAGGGTITFNCGAAPKIVTVSDAQVLRANTENG